MSDDKEKQDELMDRAKKLDEDAGIKRCRRQRTINFIMIVVQALLVGTLAAIIKLEGTGFWVVLGLILNAAGVVAGVHFHYKWGKHLMDWINIKEGGQGERR